MTIWSILPTNHENHTLSDFSPKIIIDVFESEPKVQKYLKLTACSYRCKDNISKMDTEKEIRVIEQGSEDSLLISKAMASSTASTILAALSEHPKTATELEDDTGYPLPTIHYHLGNLLNAGLVQVSRIRYSEKGKPMKLYATADTILVISPKRKTEDDVRSVLRKYGFTSAGFILAVSAAVTVCNTVLFGNFVPQISRLSVVSETSNAVGGAMEGGEDYSILSMVEIPKMATMEIADATDNLLSQINTGMLVFLIVSLLILFGMLVFDIIRIRRNEGQKKCK